MRIIYLLFPIILLGACTEKQVIIKAQVNSNNFTLDGKIIEKNEIEKELGILVKEKTELGFNPSELIIHITADKETPKHEMSEIEKAIRRSHLDRKYFWKEK
tara:strand:- start:952 stop:1257 length:306 start_codon:yes stop_codon:yes gene_type:complete